MFTAGSLIKDLAFARRTYARGGAHVTMTLARYPITARQYDDWVQMSTAGYPQATLDVPPGSGNGFYQCTPGATSHCNLLIQLRAGAHIEIRGDRTTPRDDIDAVARGLPLRALAVPTAP